MDDHHIEYKVFRLSIMFSILFATLGIVLGMVFSSAVIIFDGIYAIFGVATSFATLKISQFIHKKDHFNFPFGKASIEPVAVLIQYVLLSVVLMYTLVDAVQVIVRGGSEVSLGGAIIYLCAVTLILFLAIKKMEKMSEKAYSSLLVSEIKQWKITFRQSLFALSSYGVSFAILLLSYEGILPYIDPVILIIFVIVTFITVIKEIIGAFKEIIGMRAISSQLYREIEQSVKELVTQYGMIDYYLRVNKAGSTITVEVDFLVDKEFEFGKVHEQDHIREEFEKSLADIEYELWLSIAFTTQYKWVA